jgi:transposase
MASRRVDKRRDAPNQRREAPLADLERSDIVVMDNFGSHNGKFIRSAGAKVFFLPKCSPDLNTANRYPLN